LRDIRHFRYATLTRGAALSFHADFAKIDYVFRAMLSPCRFAATLFSPRCRFRRASCRRCRRRHATCCLMVANVTPRYYADAAAILWMPCRQRCRYCRLRHAAVIARQPLRCYASARLLRQQMFYELRALL